MLSSKNIPEFDANTAGLDEVGRGCLAGPVVAGAAILKLEDFKALAPKEKSLIRDSKTLSASQREKALVLIQKISIGLGIGLCESWEIDQMGLQKATFLAMERALSQLPFRPCSLLIDGPWCLPQWTGSQFPLVAGDRLSPVISAASIIAKVFRDHKMQEMDKLYPGYGFYKNVGYGTLAHRQALLELGPTPQHRRSFAPLKSN